MANHLNVPRLILLCFSCITISCTTERVPSEEQLITVAFETTIDNSEKNYYLYLPRGYGDEPQKKWPVMMFLHGNGERGNGNDELDYVLIHGPVYEAWIQKKNLPFVIISPQLPMFGMDTMGISYLVDRDINSVPKRLENGVPERSPDFPTPQEMAGASPIDSLPYITLPRGWDMVEEDLLGMIDHVLENYNTDSNRLYLTGLSYGGFGTWYLASKHPETFAAAVPVVGWGHPDLMDPIANANLPIWAFSGGRDLVIEKKYFLKGLNKLEELGHTNLRYTIHEDMHHDAWTRVYSGDDVYNWLLLQQK